MKKLITLLFSIFALSLTSICLASNVYTWTDELGEVHYGDRVPHQFKSSAKLLKKHSSRKSSTKNNTSASMLQKKLEGLNKRKEEQAKQEESTKKKLAEEKKLKEDCNLARSNLKTIQDRSRIRIKEKNGEYRMLTHEEKTEKENTLKKQIKEFCSK